MIYAKNADALAYRGIHPNLDLALEHITPEFLAALRDNQRVELKGDLVYCTRFTSRPTAATWTSTSWWRGRSGWT